MATISITLPDVLTRKFSGHTFDVEVAKLHPAVLAHIFTYGMRTVNDYTNSVNKARKEGGASSLGREDIARYVDTLYDGTWVEKAAAATGDPVVIEMRKLALEAVFRALGVSKWEDCANHPKGAKYIERKEAASSGKSYLKANNEALDAFADANPKLKLRERAEAIVNAREEEGEADAITL